MATGLFVQWFILYWRLFVDWLIDWLFVCLLFVFAGLFIHSFIPWNVGQLPNQVKLGKLLFKEKLISYVVKFVRGFEGPGLYPGSL